jgi:chemotaxis protein methyltransferase CheR
MGPRRRKRLSDRSCRSNEAQSMQAEIVDDLSESEFQQISDMVYRHCGINLHDGKKDLVRARIAKRIRSGGFGSTSAYIQAVQNDPSRDEFHHLIDSISTNLTSFFREGQHFEYLRTRLLPTLMTHKKRRNDRIRAWSAGCSTGEEPYSLAMTLLDVVGPEADIKLLATDISRRVLDVARRGVYEKTRVDSIPAALRTRFFAPAPGLAGKFQASRELRSIIQFNYLNLMDSWPFTGPFDFIFCRNVMIYFDKPTQHRLIQRYWDCLASGGCLFTGHSESLTGVSHQFRYVQPTIYMKP